MKVIYNNEVLELKINKTCSVIEFTRVFRNLKNITGGYLKVYKGPHLLMPNGMINPDSTSVLQVILQRNLFKSYSDTSEFASKSNQTNRMNFKDKIKQATGAKDEIKEMPQQNSMNGIEGLLAQIQNSSFNVNSQQDLQNLLAQLTNSSALFQQPGIHHNHEDDASEGDDEDEEEQVEPNPEFVQQLMEMGFAKERAERVLVFNNNDLDSAVTMMLAGSDDILGSG